MSKTYEEIQSELEALTAAAKELKEARVKLAQDEGREIVTVYDYKVTWINEHMFKCERTMSIGTMFERNLWKDKWPDVPTPWMSRSEDEVHSMNYLLITNLMIHHGGGYHVLKDTRGKARIGWHDVPLELTTEEVDSLREDCVVPDSLKLA